jgi:hypothetical protein
MYLRNFANERQLLRLVDRGDVSRAIPSSVNNACNEVGFYSWEPGLSADDVEDPSLLDPEFAEKSLSVFEGRAEGAIGRVLASGQPPATPQDRFDLTHFVALQTTRGRRFREDLNQAGTLAMRRHLLGSLTSERVEQWLIEHDEPHAPADVQDFMDEALSERGPRLVADGTFAVQQALGFAMLNFAPSIWSRHWTVIEFSEPALLTSDEPVTMWHPDNEPVSILTAPFVWMPLDRRHALELTFTWNSEPDSSRHGDQTQADFINTLVASQAERWVILHPSDSELISRIDVGPRTVWAEEVLETHFEGDTMHVVGRVRRLPML